MPGEPLRPGDRGSSHDTSVCVPASQLSQRQEDSILAVLPQQVK